MAILCFLPCGHGICKFKQYLLNLSLITRADWSPAWTVPPEGGSISILWQQDMIFEAFSLSVDHNYRLTSHIKKFFPKCSQIGCGTLEEALHILAWAVCTKISTPPNQSAISNQVINPNQNLTSQKSLQVKQMAKAKWQKFPKRVTKMPRSQKSKWHNARRWPQSHWTWQSQC